jgi:uncharacterized membrane protein YheB (UPF0754 family)
MLFHPYEPPRLFGRPIRLLQGAIPKNNGRLAAAMGRTVGQKLLTPEDLANTVSEPAFRAAFDDRLAAFVRAVFDERRGSVASMLPAEAVAELRAVFGDAADALLARLDAYLASEAALEAARGWADALAAELADEPIGAVLTPEREAAIAETAERWMAEAVEGEGFVAAVRDSVDRGAVRLLQPGRTFQELLPIGLVAAVERAISGYLPLAIERLAGVLEDPEAKQRVERVLHELLDRFMRDLKFHQRLVAAFIITPETIDRVLKAVEAEGATKIADLLHDDAVRDAMARGVNNAIVDFLGKSVVSVLGSPGDGTVEDAKRTVAGWAVTVAREPQTRAFLIERLRGTLTAAERRTWGDLFRHLPPDRVADLLITAARGARARSLYRDAADRIVEFLLHRDIGRIADHVAPDTAERVERMIAPPLWRWIQEQIPPIAQRLDIAARVERKILDFPMQQVEALVKGVTERELKLIVRLGYVLGGIIGLVSAGVSLLL